MLCFVVGVFLAVLEKAKVLDPLTDSNGIQTSAGTVSAGYQNFFICIEMLFAALALRSAFPYRVYAAGCITDASGRSVTMQSISSSLKVRFSVLLFCSPLNKIYRLILNHKSSICMYEANSKSKSRWS